MTKHVHGGDVYRHPGTIDFSSNCNPLGPPKGVIRAVGEAAERMAYYPDVQCEELRRRIGEYENVPPEGIICGNGAADLIFSLCLALKPRKALLLAPTFAEYEQALKSVGCEITYAVLEEEKGFVPGQSLLEKIDGSLDIMFFCNPNNPTGVLASREYLEKLLEKCRECQVLLAVDECFLDFVREPEAYTLKAYLDSYDCLFIFKAFTKRYAMAGVRLGYGLCGSPGLLEAMKAVSQPWNVSSLAQSAGIAALRETEYVKEGRQLVFRESDFLKEKLSALGVKVYDSQANYLFFYTDCADFYGKCLEKGIMVRDCSNYVGLKTGFYRIAVRTREENERLAGAFEAVLSGPCGIQA